MYTINKIKTNLQRLFLSGTLMLGMILSAGLFASCSEDDAATEEFSGWQSKNDTYWKNLYNETQRKIAAGDNSWEIILNYSYQNQQGSDGKAPVYSPGQYVIVHKLENGTGSGTPLYTDTAFVHYQGRLIPSVTYTSGLVFDASWGSETYNPQTSRPRKITLGGVASESNPVSGDGFSTAIQKMHIGDHWTVYIPYQLGYGASALDKIPAYSNLIFDVRLHSYRRAGKKMPN